MRLIAKNIKFCNPTGMFVDPINHATNASVDTLPELMTFTANSKIVLPVADKRQSLHTLCADDFHCIFRLGVRVPVMGIHALKCYAWIIIQTLCQLYDVVAIPEKSS